MHPRVECGAFFTSEVTAGVTVAQIVARRLLEHGRAGLFAKDGRLEVLGDDIQLSRFG